MRSFKLHLYWIIPSIVYLISSLFSVINVDGVRDYLAAYKIVVDSKHTLMGPEMAFSFNIGPIWYYLMTIPVLISKSWGVMSFFVSVLTALKFYYAYRLGKLILGTEFAIFLVFSLMLASFTIVQQITFTHTNLVELSILAIIYYTWVSNDKTLSWFIIGILFGLAIHAHPTTIVASFWIVLKLYESKSRIKNAAMIFAGVVLVFLPLIIHEIMSDFENIKGAIAYLKLNTDATDYPGLFKLIYGSIFITALGTYKMLFPVNVASGLFLLHCTLVLLTLIFGLISVFQLNNKIKILFYKLALFFIFTVLVLYFIRKTTPWYMTYSISLSFSLLLSLLLWAIYKNFDLKKMPQLLYVIGFIVFISSMVILMYKLNNNLIRPPASAWNNVRTVSAKLLLTDGYEIPAYLASAHGRFLCKNSPVTLHGPYSALIKSHSGIEYLSKCNEDGLYYGLYYGPSNSINSLFAIPASLSKYIQKQPIHIIGNSYFYELNSISNKQNLHQEKFLSEYENSITYIGDWSSKHDNVTIYHGNYLIITKVLGYRSELLINHVKVNDVFIKPIALTNYSTLYACENCDGETSTWEIDYSESVKGMTNIVTF